MNNLVKYNKEIHLVKKLVGKKILILFQINLKKTLNSIYAYPDRQERTTAG